MSLEITLTGQLAAEADGNRADATDLPGRQAPLVFAYLVAERDRPVPTEELAEAVWGGALPPTWRPALRGVVSKVRDFLDRLGLPAADALTSSSGCYRLVLPSDTAVDVELAEGEADAARRALSQGRLAQALAAADRANAIAGRPLLPGHDGAWIEDRRAALHQVLIRSLELLVDVHLAAGHGTRAVGPAAELVALEPFRDSAHRRLLAAHTAAGDRGEALRSYDRYRRVLAEELGVGPSSELEAAYLELLHREPATGTPAGRPAAGPPAPPAPAPPTGAFVGRDAELGRLRDAWADARGGRRRTVLVAGESGIGKTRLVAELAALAEDDGAVVLAGRCDQHLGVPYLPLREAVGRHLAGYPSERLRALLGPRAAELVRFWPELAWRLPALPAPATTGQATDPYLLFEALTGLLEAIAVSSPLLLLVDDLHGADEASLLLLRSLAEASRPARLLTVLTYRDDPGAPRASLTAALGDLVRSPGAELLTLDGLSTDDVASMAAAATAHPPGAGGAALAQVLRERTGGNPFLVTELLRHLVETGTLGGGDGTEAAAGPAVDDVPESVRWVVGQRLARLGGPVEHVLGVAAVVGYEAEVALLGRVADLGPDSLQSAPAATASASRSCATCSTGAWPPATGHGSTAASARPWRTSPAARTAWASSPTRRWPGTAPCGRPVRPPPWPPPPSSAAWPPSWATKAWPSGPAGPGPGRCWPPATSAASTGWPSGRDGSPGKARLPTATGCRCACGRPSPCCAATSGAANGWPRRRWTSAGARSARPRPWPTAPTWCSCPGSGAVPTRSRFSWSA
jgi:DNA-binding SARP family transcriptional activator